MLFPIFCKSFPGFESHIDYLWANPAIVQRLANFVRTQLRDETHTPELTFSAVQPGREEVSRR